MMNNILHNIIMSKFTPEMRSQFDNFRKMAIQSGNPQQYMLQQLGNNPIFQKVMNIRQGKTSEEFNNYLGNINNSLNNQNMV